MPCFVSQISSFVIRLSAVDWLSSASWCLRYLNPSVSYVCRVFGGLNSVDGVKYLYYCYCYNKTADELFESSRFAVFFYPSIDLFRSFLECLF